MDSKVFLMFQEMKDINYAIHLFRGDYIIPVLQEKSKNLQAISS